MLNVVSVHPGGMQADSSRSHTAFQTAPLSHPNLRPRIVDIPIGVDGDRFAQGPNQCALHCQIRTKVPHIVIGTILDIEGLVVNERLIIPFSRGVAIAVVNKRVLHDAVRCVDGSSLKSALVGQDVGLVECSVVAG